jgi:alanyl-tRNA synthetase
MQELEAAIADLDGTIIPGAVVFKLYDTFGFPVDLTADIARERQLTLDMEGFEAAMQAQKERARAASSFAADAVLELNDNPQTKFNGYEHLTDKGCEVLALYVDGQSVNTMTSGQSGIIVLDQTPFYAESGGQVGDIGMLYNQQSRCTVQDTQKQNEQFLHQGALVEGEIALGDRLEASVDTDMRRATMLNHSATHLMHAALRQVLGTHVSQKGSLVSPKYLRFDFSHNKPVTPDEVREIEAIVNRQVLKNVEVSREVMSMDAAKKKGAMALFGEKYGSEVRVVSMGLDSTTDDEASFSIELCGGTHVNRTGDIGLFKIVAESGIAAGVRRIEAVTGDAALVLVQEQEERLRTIAAAVKSGTDKVVDRVEQLTAANRQLEKDIEQLKAKLTTLGIEANEIQDAQANYA